MQQQKFGDDFSVGDVYETQAITVTETHLVNWASLTMDFYPLHVDREYAAKTPFGERLAHGPLIFGLAVGLASISGFGGNAVLAWLGADNMRMKAPVKIGDTIRVLAEVRAKKPTSKPGREVQIWLYTVKNQRDEPVMVFDYSMMFHTRTEGWPGMKEKEALA